MSNVVVDRNKLDYLANAIAHKASVSIPLTLSAMVSAVDAMSVSLQHISKSYSPSTSAISETFTPSVGFDGIGQLDISIASMQILSGQESITGIFFTEGGQRKWTAMADFMTSDFSGWMDGANSAILHGYKTYSAVSSNIVVYPDQYQYTIGGANYMMESAIVIKPIPSSYIVPSGTSSITSNGTFDIASYKSVNVSVIGGADTRFAEMVNGTISVASDTDVTIVKPYKFWYASKLKTVSFPNATYIGSNAFYSCPLLENVYLPSTSNVSTQGFTSCPKISQIELASCQTIGSSAFQSCYSLATASFPAAQTIYGNAFKTCRKLLSLYLMGSTVAYLASTTAFTSTPIGGYTNSTAGSYGKIYVPSSLYSTYISSAVWSTYSSRFVSV